MEKPKRYIVAVGVEIDKETNGDKAFTIEFNTGGILQTEGELTKETCRLIRHLQAEVMLKSFASSTKGVKENEN